jgi:hypothetical protein
MANSELTKAIKKGLKQSNLGGSKELTPGSTGRRFEPKEGLNNLKKRIHKESKYVDDNKNLPFTFSKPKKNTRSCYKKCTACGDIKHVNINTVGIECKKCNSYTSLEEIDE